MQICIFSKLMLVVSALIAALSGCTTKGGDSDNVMLEPLVDWSDGLTEKEVLSKMEVSVEVDTAGTGNVITWQVPEGAVDVDEWGICRKDAGDEWECIEGASGKIIMDTETEEGISYVNAVYKYVDTDDTDSSLTTEYKIVSTDDSGEEVSNQVTQLNFPTGSTFTVTLSEESEASAQSGIELIYNGEKQTLWEIQKSSGLALPQSINIDTPLSADANLQIIVTSLFPNYEESVVVRTSSSSFCLIEEVTPLSAASIARLKFSFEDLPLTRLSAEAGGVFDYNDVVLYLDVLAP